MRTSRKWMFGISAAMGTVLSVGSVSATPPSKFSTEQIAMGRFEEFSVRTQFFPEGFGGNDLWFSMMKTKGPSDLYVVRNTWGPGGTTGWHTHPGHSMIIVTSGAITAYDGDDPSCTPHVYTPASSGVGTGLIDGNHLHMIRNETLQVATAVVVQLVPAGEKRRIEAPEPFTCP